MSLDNCKTKAICFSKTHMSQPSRILNVTRGYTLRHKQALRAIENCAAKWVEPGISIRDLTLAESIAARNEKARLREPLAFAELPWIEYEPSLNGEVANRKSFALIQAANQLCAANAVKETRNL